ncbi:helix-turn-helix transcriptional regulator [Nocardia sp. NPDC046473]|uniref:helix-turn-helix domain-containing protein n=1 Tax=Nocardia sp. NPDC046473 TaxID=3155733 RepID=UPI0033C04E8D
MESSVGQGCSSRGVHPRVTGVDEARQALGHRLRDIRKDAGLTGTRLAALAGWHSSKVSKIEYGKQTPTDDDIRVWCIHTGTADQVPDLLATLRNVEAAYLEFRRLLGSGTRRRQQQSITLEDRARLLRWYESNVLPGLLHTPPYAEAILRQVIDFYDIPDDLDEGVASRIERQRVLYHGDHKFHFIIAEQALYTVMGDADVMIGQLDRLLTVMQLPRVVLGVIPLDVAHNVVTTNFVIYDARMVMVETIAAELTITQPREITLYEKAFDLLRGQAEYGKDARAYITAALDRLRTNG